MHSLQKKLIISIVTCIFLSCSSSADLSNCGNNSIDIGFDSCLLFDKDNRLNSYKSLIETSITETLININTIMPMSGIKIRIRVSADNTIPEIGIGGFNPNENNIIISINPDFEQLTNSLINELPPLLAHEAHHAKRRRAIGYGSTLLEAMISEGLADSFSIELFNINPPLWSNTLNETEMEEWIETANDVWNNADYNHSDWFLGTNPNIPRWTGYSIGFKLTQDFIQANANSFASRLFGEPANSFVQ